MALLIRIGIRLAASAVGLAVAAIVLSRMSITVTGFLLVVLIFTAISTIVEPFIRNLAERYARPTSALVGLGVTWLALLLTDLISDSLSIEGPLTWIVATLIVWAFALAADVVLGRLLGGRGRRREVARS